MDVDYKRFPVGSAISALLWLLGENPRLAVDSDMLREHMLRRERAAA